MKATSDVKISDSSEPSFSINGRFYCQPITGVQRYAREIVLEIDNALLLQENKANLFLPSGVVANSKLKAIRSINVSGASGHLWEQTILPRKIDKPLLNLCNTGPIAIRRQIVCMHDTNVFDAPSSYSRSFQLLYRGLMPLLARRAAIVTSVSHASAERLSHHLGIPLTKIPVLPNGHEHTFRWDPASSNLSNRLNRTRPYVMLLGSSAQHKNAAFILSQAAALDKLGLDLVVAGGAAQIFTQIEDFGASNIYKVGFVTDDDLAWLYSHALCLAFPSFAEGFGIPLVEAMALGCPIVSSNSSCMPEICGNAALLADPNDTQAWLRYFGDLISTPSLRDELRGLGYLQVKKFSWRSSALGYLDLLTSI